MSPRYRPALLIQCGRSPFWGLSLALGIFVTSSLAAVQTAGKSEPLAGEPETGAPVKAEPLASGSGFDLAAARSELKSALQALDVDVSPPAKGQAPGHGSSSAATRLKVREAAFGKALKEILTERANLLDRYEQALKSQAAARAAQANLDQEWQAIRRELGEINRRLSVGKSDPDSLIPGSIRDALGSDSTAFVLEIKESLDALEGEVKADQVQLEAARDEQSKLDVSRETRRRDRDALFQRTTGLGARCKELREAVAGASNQFERRLAEERLKNCGWELHLEQLRLALVEQEIALEPRLSDVREWQIERLKAKLQLAQLTFEQTRRRFRTAAEDRRLALERAAREEENRARRAVDPIERFRARRTAELLALEAQVVRHEQALAAPASPSLREQRELADKAEADFARIRTLLDDGHVSRLDAIQLNNGFRRIGPERDRLVRNELATAEMHVQYYEDLLSNLELEMLQDSLHDQFDLDFSREHPPADRLAEGKAIWAELEGKHRALLARHRAILEKLSDRAIQTLGQVTRRLRLLDEQDGFIRTHIFWVRDQDPLGAWTIVRLVRDVRQTGAGLLRLIKETAEEQGRSKPSVEFIMAVVGLVLLPPVLLRLRRLLLKAIARGELKLSRAATAETPIPPATSL